MAEAERSRGNNENLEQLSRQLLADKLKAWSLRTPGPLLVGDGNGNVIVALSVHYTDLSRRR